MMHHPIRYARLGYCQLHVTDLSRSTLFYRDLMGLVVECADDRQVWLRCSDKPYDIILEQGDIAGLARIGLELENAQELEKAFDHLRHLGHQPVWTDEGECHDKCVTRAFRFRNPDSQLELDFYAGQAVATTPYMPTLTKIARLGHVVLNVGNFEKAIRFWVDELGFAESDRVPGRVSWLRCWPNPLHHSFALIASEADGLNHINFMVTDIDDIGRAMNRMQQAEVPIVFGPGRHLPSTSIFLYFLDPDQLTNEYSFGMELIEEAGGRSPRELEHSLDVLDTWGGRPDPRFGANGAIVQHHD